VTKNVGEASSGSSLARCSGMHEACWNAPRPSSALPHLVPIKSSDGKDEKDGKGWKPIFFAMSLFL